MRQRNKHDAPSEEEMKAHELYGVLRHVVRWIANVSFEHRENQDAVHDLEVCKITLKRGFH